MPIASRSMSFAADPKLPNTTGWQNHHTDALHAPCAGFESALVSMLDGWLEYATTHAAQYGSLIGNDGVLGDHWAAIGDGLRGLLNGAAGRLDCGTIDHRINGILAANAVEVEE